MTTIADKLNTLLSVKQNLCTAIENKGVPMNGVPFEDYPSRIAMISSTPTSPANRLSDDFMNGNWDYNTYQRILQDASNSVDGALIDYSAIAPGTQVVEGIYRVNRSRSNYLAINATSSVDLFDPFNAPAPVFWVDWGDGPTESGGHNGTTVTKEYDFDALVAAGYSVVNTGSGLDYIEVRFKLRAAVGAMINSLNFQLDSTTGIKPALSCHIYRLAINLPYLTSLTISPGIGKGKYSLDILSEVWIGENAVTDMTGLFADCSLLRNVKRLDTLSCTNLSYMFYNCTSLETIPEINDSNVSNYEAMFQNAVSLITIPLLSFRKAFNLSNMFNNSGVVALPPCTTFGVDLDPAPVAYQYLDNMFMNCKRLISTPVYDFTRVVSAAGMYKECSNLRFPPAGYDFSFPNADQLSELLLGCVNLDTMAGVIAPLATDVTQMFSMNKRLLYITLDAPNAIYLNGTFEGCHNVRVISISGYESNSLRAQETFSECFSLTEIELIPGPNGIRPINLARLPFTGPLRTDSILGLFNAASAWVDPGTGQDNIINMTGLINNNLSASDIAIVENKGYVVQLP